MKSLKICILLLLFPVLVAADDAPEKAILNEIKELLTEITAAEKVVDQLLLDHAKRLLLTGFVLDGQVDELRKSVASIKKNLTFNKEGVRRTQLIARKYGEVPPSDSRLVKNALSSLGQLADVYKVFESLQVDKMQAEMNSKMEYWKILITYGGEEIPGLDPLSNEHLRLEAVEVSKRIKDGLDLKDQAVLKVAEQIFSDVRFINVSAQKNSEVYHKFVSALLHHSFRLTEATLAMATPAQIDIWNYHLASMTILHEGRDAARKVFSNQYGQLFLKGILNSMHTQPAMRVIAFDLLEARNRNYHPISIEYMKRSEVSERVFLRDPYEGAEVKTGYMSFMDEYAREFEVSLHPSWLEVLGFKRQSEFIKSILAPRKSSKQARSCKTIFAG